MLSILCWTTLILHLKVCTDYPFKTLRLTLAFKNNFFVYIPASAFLMGKLLLCYRFLDHRSEIWKYKMILINVNLANKVKNVSFRNLKSNFRQHSINNDKLSNVDCDLKPSKQNVSLFWAIGYMPTPVQSFFKQVKR